MLFAPPTAPWSVALSYAMATGGLFGLVLVASRDFGTPLAPGAFQGVDWWPMYLLMVGLVLLPIVAVIHRRWLASRSPVPLGTYLFPTAVVAATDDDITVHRFESSPQVATSHGPEHVVVDVLDGGRRFRMRIDRTMEAMQQIAFAASALRAGRMSAIEGDTAWLLQVDPLVGSGVGPFPRALKPLPKPLLSPWPIAAMLSITVAPGLAMLRDEFSDSILIDQLQHSEDLPAIRWYAGSPGRLAEEAAMEWLPRLAETRFSRGVELRSSQYWYAYLEDFDLQGGTVRANHLPDALLEEAVASGSIAKLREFIAAHQDPRHEGRRMLAQQTIDRKYADALSAFDAQAIEGRRLRQAMDATLEWLRLNDSSAVQVVFRPGAPAGIDIADKILLREQAGAGCSEVTPAAPFLQRERWIHAESRIVQLLQRGFASIAPSDVLSLVATDVAELDPSRPRLEVEYRVMPLGSSRNPVVFREEATNECLLGLAVRFELMLIPPGKASAYSIRVSAQPPEYFTVGSYGRFTDASTDSAYDRMLGLAFDDLATALRTQLFAPDSAASSRMEEELQTWGAEAEAKSRGDNPSP